MYNYNLFSILLKISVNNTSLSRQTSVFAKCANIICNGSPSLILKVRLISFGITIRPRSSILLTIPVAFNVLSSLNKKIQVIRKFCLNLLTTCIICLLRDFILLWFYSIIGKYRSNYYTFYAVLPTSAFVFLIHSKQA